MTDDHLFWKDKTLIVSLDSRKGGVGKSTVGLAIAQEWLSNGLYPAVAIDADLLGSELADTINPVKRPKDRYPMGLLDLLTQSTGGNTHFDVWLKKWLEKHKPGKDLPPEDRLPMLELADVAATGEPDREPRNNLVVFPTLAETSVEGRTRAKEGLSLRFLSDDFGRAQIELRLAMLLGRIITEWNPKLIVVDGSPFHVGLGKAVKTIFETLPEFLNTKLKDKLKEACWIRLEVLGTEPTEVSTLNHSISLESNSLGKKERASGWILNRDHFRTHISGDSALDCIAFEFLKIICKGKMPPLFLGPNFLHVLYSPRYSLQTALMFLEETESPGTPGKRFPNQIMYRPEIEADWQKMWKSLVEELKLFKKMRWDDDKKYYTPISWAEFMKGAFS